jgi:large subunit ribosomal protein L15
VRLGEIPAPPGATRRSKRLGIGESSGHGKTSGRGHKGQRARSGPGLRPEFEGGQTPLVRRIPKRGFRHVGPKVEWVNVGDLNRFAPGSVVDLESLRHSGLIRGRQVQVKVLGEGELRIPLTVKAHRFSRSAQQKIVQAGGSVEVLG